MCTKTINSFYLNIGSHRLPYSCRLLVVIKKQEADIFFSNILRKDERLFLTLLCRGNKNVFCLSLLVSQIMKMCLHVGVSATQALLHIIRHDVKVAFDHVTPRVQSADVTEQKTLTSGSHPE